MASACCLSLTTSSFSRIRFGRISVVRDRGRVWCGQQRRPDRAAGPGGDRAARAGRAPPGMWRGVGVGQAAAAGSGSAMCRRRDSGSCCGGTNAAYCVLCRRRSFTTRQRLGRRGTIPGPGVGQPAAVADRDPPAPGPEPRAVGQLPVHLRSMRRPLWQTYVLGSEIGNRGHSHQLHCSLDFAAQYLHGAVNTPLAPRH